MTCLTYKEQNSARLGKGKEKRKEPIVKWMESVTLMMGAPLEDLKNQRRDRSVWRKPIYWSLRTDTNLMAYNQSDRKNPLQ